MTLCSGAIEGTRDRISFLFFFFNDTATTEIYTLSLHDALPISGPDRAEPVGRRPGGARPPRPQRLSPRRQPLRARRRSEEHTSELQVTSLSRMPSSA